MNNKNISIIGLGFMGIALAKAIRKLNKNNNVIGYDINEEIKQYLTQEHLIDKTCSNLKDLTESSDLIILATPVSTFNSIATQIREYIRKQIIVDIGSVKGKVYKNITNILSNNSSCYVPSHPIAGGKSLDINDIKNEIDRVPDNLFQNKITHLFPNNSKRENFEFVKHFYINIGAIINTNLTLQQHDKIYALTSHIPMFISAIFLSLLTNDSKNNVVYKYFLEKLLDKMWLSVFIDNIENIEYWCGKINIQLKNRFSSYDISNIVNNLVKTNNFVDFTGKGYNVFVSYDDKDSFILVDEFITIQKQLILLCKKNDIVGLQQFLLKTYGRFKYA